MGTEAQKFQDLLTAYIAKLYIEELESNRDALEEAAIEAMCACRRYTLVDALHEIPDNELLAIVTKRLIHALHAASSNVTRSVIK